MPRALNRRLPSRRPGAARLSTQTVPNTRNVHPAFTVFFAGYKEGNLSWLAALEAEPATDVMALLPYAKYEAELTGPAAQVSQKPWPRLRRPEDALQPACRGFPHRCHVVCRCRSGVALTLPVPHLAKHAGAAAQLHAGGHPPLCRRIQDQGAQKHPGCRLLG